MEDLVQCFLPDVLICVNGLWKKGTTKMKKKHSSLSVESLFDRFSTIDLALASFTPEKVLKVFHVLKILC